MQSIPFSFDTGIDRMKVKTSRHALIQTRPYRKFDKPVRPA